MNKKNLLRSNAPIITITATSLLLAGASARAGDVLGNDNKAADPSGQNAAHRSNVDPKIYTDSHMRQLAMYVSLGMIPKQDARKELLKRLQERKQFFRSDTGLAFMSEATIFEVLEKFDKYCGADAHLIMEGEKKLEDFLSKNGFPSVWFVSGSIQSEFSREKGRINSNGFFLFDGSFVTAKHCTDNIGPEFDPIHVDPKMDRAIYSYLGDVSHLSSPPPKLPLGTSPKNGDVIMAIGYDHDNFSRANERMLVTNCFEITEAHTKQMEDREKKLNNRNYNYSQMIGMYGFILNHQEVGSLTGMSGSPVFNEDFEVVGVLTSAVPVSKAESRGDVIFSYSRDDTSFYLVAFCPITKELLGEK